jgi:hypothetical protein
MINPNRGQSKNIIETSLKIPKKSWEVPERPPKDLERKREKLILIT